MAGFDLIVIGAGLSGMFAGVLAARRGARVLVIAQGQGGANTSTGCVNILGYDTSGQPLINWDQAWSNIRVRQHPYSKVNREELDQAIAELIQICSGAGYPLQYRPGENFLLPAAIGSVRAAALVPDSMAAGDLRRPGDIILADFPGFRDFYPSLAAANLSPGHDGSVRAIALPLPDAPALRDGYATDLALLFDDAGYRAKVGALWQPELAGARRIGFPAVLGLRHAPAAWRDLSERLSAEVFEIPTLPPSVPGMRLFNLLSETLKANRGELILGPRVVGHPDERSALRRVTGITAQTAGGERSFNAEAVILASGGFMHGGLHARQDGTVVESVFDLPVISDADLPSAPGRRTRSTRAKRPRSRTPDRPEGPRSQNWTSLLYLAPHLYAHYGLQVDDRLQPTSRLGEPFYANLYAVGGILAGADRISEGSREGIGLASAWKVVNILKLS